MPTSNLDETRRRYLHALLDSHGTLRLPIGSDEYAVPLQTIFQPLTLRQGPFSFEVADREIAPGSFSQANEAGAGVITARNGAEALAKSALRRMVVLGGPGMGKTTLLKALLQQAIHHAQKDYAAPLPLFISLPDLAHSGLELHAYLPNVLAKLNIEASYANTLMAAINEGRAFLCLDSLDEVIPAERAAVIAFINREAVRCGGTWVIGSRFTEYKGGQFLHSQFAEWELQPLDETMRLEMAQHLLPVLAHLLHKTSAPSPQNNASAVREALMQAIAKLGKDAPIELAIAALEDANEDVRFSARRTLLDLDVDPAIVPMQPLLEALREKRSEYDSHWSELGLLAKFGSQAPPEPLLALLGDSSSQTGEYAAEALYKTHPAVFAEVARQAQAMLRGEPIGSIFASRVQSRIADRVRLIGRATSAVLELVTDLLDWPYWEVRKKAAQALGAIHRNIPDRAIQRLMELRHDPHARAVREAADEALAEILSHESGMEEE